MLPNPSPYIDDGITEEDFIFPRSLNCPQTESYEQGGKALTNNSEGLLKYNWKAWTDGTTIFCQRIGDSTITEILKAPKITEIDLTFDQNMRPCVAFVSDSIPKLYWYDTKIGDFNITTFSGILSPRVSLDDKRDFNISNSDIIFAYIKNNGLYYRQQRERFTVEHLLKSYQNNHSKLLWRIGMGINNRFLFYVR